jgi:hypothetical protein
MKLAYVLNTTPSYFYILRLHLTLLVRYADTSFLTVFLATEESSHPTIVQLQTEFPILQILPLQAKDFLDSRLETLNLLQEFSIVLPVQEDFLLEARPDWTCIQEAYSILEKDSSIGSIRLMPCPGPMSSTFYTDSDYWKVLDFEKEMVFTYQATMWKKEVYSLYLTELLRLRNSMVSGVPTEQQAKDFALTYNTAETSRGQKVLQLLSNQKNVLHLSCRREGSQPNAVYLAPWPYRPTAIVKGKLEVWALELAAREVVSIDRLY